MTGDPDPHDVAAALRVSIGLLLRQMRQVRVAGELTVPETSALARLDRGGPATSSALARLEQISPQSMGATLSALEARGLVRRGPDARDGRRVVLSVTDLGRLIEGKGFDSRGSLIVGHDGKVYALMRTDNATGFGKGYPGEGPARLSTKHALALTNRGGATTADVIALARAVRDGVRSAFGIDLTPEPILIGCAL